MQYTILSVSNLSKDPFLYLTSFHQRWCLSQNSERLTSQCFQQPTFSDFTSTSPNPCSMGISGVKLLEILQSLALFEEVEVKFFLPQTMDQLSSKDCITSEQPQNASSQDQPVWVSNPRLLEVLQLFPIGVVQPTSVFS